MDAGAYLCDCAARVDAALEAGLPAADAAPASLHAAMRHLVFPGGKRLRPALAMAAAEAVGAPPEAALPVAVGAELVHTYSLVHDDLPCMDDDDTRRGRPTVHVAYGEALAVLAGDALQALAFEVLLADGGERTGAAAARLARAAGSRELVGGQVDDLAAETGPAPELADVLSIHRRKSAALIAAAIAGGAELAGGTPAEVALLEDFGRRVGVAFQIADDLLDADEDGACSVVPLLGVPAARERAETLLDEALAMIEDWGERAEPLRELARFSVRRKQ
ncbi:MAG: polyprenyl synthetase family protein [Myxococcota bacterium]